MAFDCDLFVIGGGSGGVRAARMAAAAGARVQLAEESRMGGTCVIRGCVPKKLMVFASAFRELPGEARAYGWEIADGRFDWPAFRTALHTELDRLEAVYRRLLDGSGVKIHDARARLAGPHEVELADGSRISAKHILIATGGHPERPDLPGARHGMVSDDVFGMEELPARMLIVGGGFIACEMACILQGLGVEVTQFYRGAQILRGFDDEARGLVAEAMRAHGINLRLGANVVALGPAGSLGDGMEAPQSETALSPHQPPASGPYAVRSTTGELCEVDAVLFATGRRPNTAGLGLEDLGVKLGRKGEIVVDQYSQTAVPSVYAIGDVTDRVNLTPVAIREGMAFVRTVFEGVPTPVDHELIPSAVFTQPELGTIGLTEEAAREQEPVEVYATSFRPMRTAFAGSDARVLMKLIVSQATRRVLGCHIVAPEAGEMIQLAAIAVKMGATKEDFDRTVAVHPTMAEELVTMRSPVRKG
ncbi:glutathione-disulfide reductase [Pseudogemmobacter humi]|uniref:Glutathione amide reductase n=1 Tax=Pseudogemmobacter humi TaxID=2483812 RepID=A0A3P5XLM5_9RHOB|nr:glutathione-disulfide reductase [Pseudogemmobacter humi]VDC31676.1 Glutathione amide reductase [Pseudogemmobacter humi]